MGIHSIYIGDLIKYCTQNDRLSNILWYIYIVHICLNIVIVKDFCYCYLLESFHRIQELGEVFTYNHIAIMSLRNRFRACRHPWF